MVNEERPISCGSPPTPELMIECCSGDLCNMNVSFQSLVEGKVLVKNTLP